ncbi:MAG: D-aminoacylase [Chloroflexi bacterium]|nr:D-aminoacylase [Chloroflexota bacterium]
MYDLLITGGRIVDGSGGPWFAGDVAIAGQRIVALGRLAPAEARVRIDAAGLVVTPGFVDFHAHSDVTLLVDSRAESAVRQGITTQVVGNCGFSAAPVRSEDVPRYQRDGLVFSFPGYSWDWTSMGEYLARLRQAHPSINVVVLTGHTALRTAVMGQADRAPTPEELAAMQQLLAQALAEGARGFSSGLTYMPSCYAKTEELIALASVLRDSGRAYHTHLRDYSRFLLEAVGEALRIGEEAGVPVYLSHLYAAGREHWGEKTAQAVRLVEEARQRGVEAAFDITLWPRGGGPFQQSIPAWAREGGLEAMIARFRDPILRARIADEVEHGTADWQGWLKPDWDDFLISRVGCPCNVAWLGRTMGELARARGQSPAETALDLLAEDEGQLWTAPTVKREEDIALILKHPLGIPISDGFALARDGPLAQPDLPKSFGTFPKVLRQHVREQGLLSLEEAVRKMTALPAARLGLWDRGLLRPGLAADLVIFDPDTVAERADYLHPNEYPVGIACVVVNGQVTVNQSGHTGAAAGEVL